MFKECSNPFIPTLISTELYPLSRKECMKSLIKHVCSFFSSKKAKQQALEQISPEIVKGCMDYLNGKECSSEIQERIEHYLKDDPNLSKKEAVEMLMDFEERKLKD